MCRIFGAVATVLQRARHDGAVNLVMSLAAESFVLHVSDVPGPDRLTIDATVAHDFIKPSRERHALARKLFKLARAGVVEISTAPQGYRIDAAGDLSLTCSMSNADPS